MLGHRNLNVDDYFAILRRRRWMIAIPAILLPGIAVAVTFWIPAQYLSQTLVIIDQQKVPDEYVMPVVSSDLDSRLASMKEQILSRSRIQPIIERYNLYPSKGNSIEDRVDLARKAIGVKPIRSDVTHTGGLPGFFITFTASDPHTAQLVCGEITSLFTSEDLHSREASAEGTTDFLKGQLDDAKRNLNEQDAKLAAFQRQFGGKLPGQELSNINMLTSLNTQLQAATQALTGMEQEKSYQESVLAQQVQNAPSSMPLGATATQTASPQIQQTELQALLAQEADLTAHYTADYPDVVTIRRKIADLRKQLAQPPASVAPLPKTASTHSDSLAIQQLRAQLHSSEIGILAKQKEQAQIQASINTYQDRIQSSPLVQEQYKELTRDYDTAQKFYDDLLTKMNHSKMATDLERRQEGQQFRVMDEPNLPEDPTFPKPGLFALAGLVLGLGLGIGLASLFEYKDTSLRTERDVWAFTKLPTLAVISFSMEIEDSVPPTGLARFWPFSRRKRSTNQLAKASS
jgi:polysaccharide chain length determinant protein (PEP-CTERM system associated)